jgi:sec-independent protein translocase protein TatA
MTPMLASLLNLAGPDMIVVLLIVLLLFGSKKLPELARGMGKAVKEFGAARDEIQKGLSEPASTLTVQTKPVEVAGDPLLPG